MNISELEARIAELEEAVNYALAIDDFVTVHWMKNELRARAFPPKTETVKVKRWECTYCEAYTKTEKAKCPHCNSSLIELTGHYQRPIVAKVKRREEVMHTGDIRAINGAKAPAYPNRKVFVEWEE